MKKLPWFVFLSLTLAGVASADFNLAEWQYQKSVAVREAKPGEFARLVLDQDVLVHAQASLNDLRLIKGGNEEVAYVARVAGGRNEVKNLPVQIIDRGHTTDRSVLTVDLGQSGLLHNEITLDIINRNFRRSVRLEASDDNRTWVTILGQNDPTPQINHGYIYDYSLEFHAADTTLSYGPSSKRYLRLTVFNNGQTPLEITRVRATKRDFEQPARLTFRPLLVNKTQNEAERASLYTFDLERAGTPVDRFLVSLDGNNYHRRVALEGSNDLNDWRVLKTNDYLYAYETKEFFGSKSSVDFPESRFRYYRLTVFNGDDPELEIRNSEQNHSQFSGLAREVFFRYAPGINYQLFYGNTQARAAEYDLVNYLPVLNFQNTTSFVLEAEVKNASFVPPPPILPPISERYPGILIIALVLVVLAIGFIAFRLIRQNLVPDDIVKP